METLVGSSLYQKNFAAEFTHLYRPSLCYKIIVNRHNIGHPNGGTLAKNIQKTSVSKESQK